MISLLLFFALKNIFVLLAKPDSDELCCPAKVQYHLQQFIVWTDTNIFSFCLCQPHQRKRKYFHPLGIFSFKRSVSCQFTYWRPAHYLNGPFSITKQLCHWQLMHHTSDLASPAVKFDISCECRLCQFRLLGTFGADTCFKFTVTWYQKTADSFDLKDGGSAFSSP